MHVVVCLKHILDPELPARDFQIDAAARRVREENAVRVLSPFDENALELALLLQEQLPGTTVSAVSLGNERAEEALRRALALKADRAVLIRDTAFDELDPYGTATLLAAGLRKLGQVDLVLCGRQAGDWDHGQVGALLAEMLGMPYVSLTFSLRFADGRLRIVREIAGGTELVELPPPAVVSVTNHEANQLRFPKTRDLLQARRQPLITWSAGDLGAGLPLPRLELSSLSLPPVEEAACEWITGDSPEEQAARLLAHLKESGLMAARG